MSSQFSLFKTRRFTPMFITQFTGALNDNITKQAIVLLLTYQAASSLGMSPGLITNLAAVIFILPFFFLSATAGQITDKFDKAFLSRRIKDFEIAIMLVVATGFLSQHYTLLLVALFMLGVHSTLFGPIKYAYLPQVLKQDELVGGNALFQSGTSLAILAGMILGGSLIAGGNHSALAVTSVVLVVIAVTGRIASSWLPAAPPSDSELKIDPNIMRASWQIVRSAWQQPAIWWSIIGVSWFWYYGATLITNAPLIARDYFHGSEASVSLLLALFSVGVATGSLLCKRLLGDQISLKLLPAGLIGLSLFTGDLFFALQHIHAIAPVAGDSVLYGLKQILAIPADWRVLADITLIGLSGGFYIVPLYAYLQYNSPENQRARIIAANNILNALFMVMSAVAGMVILGVLKLPLEWLFAGTALLNIIVGGSIFYRLKQAPVKPSSTLLPNDKSDKENRTRFE